jgi:hypothetical protein
LVRCWTDDPLGFIRPLDVLLGLEILDGNFVTLHFCLERISLSKVRPIFMEKLSSHRFYVDAVILITRVIS